MKRTVPRSVYLRQSLVAMRVSDLVLDNGRIERKVFASRVVRTREVNRPLAVTGLPALTHQVSKHQEHRVVLEPVEAFVRQPVAPLEFAADGIPCGARRGPQWTR